MIKEFDDWKQELILTDNMVQDEDKSPEVTENRARLFDRYMELVKMVEGFRTPEVFQALIDSLQARHHYGGYNITFHTLRRFPSPEFLQYLVASLPSLIRRNLDARVEEWVSDILCDAQEDEEIAQQFNFYLLQASAEEQRLIKDFLFRLQETGGLERESLLGRK